MNVYCESHTIAFHLRIVIFNFQIHHLIAEMKEIYSKARVCPYKQIDGECNLNLDHGYSFSLICYKEINEHKYNINVTFIFIFRY